VSFDGQSKKMEYNSTSHASFAPLLGLLPTVLYAPEDASLVTGTPSERRRFIDFHLAQMDPLYVHHFTRYQRAMKQRNHLLRQQSEVAIEPWEHSMAHSASYIVQKREEAAFSFKAPLAHYMQLLSRNEDTLEMKYTSSLPPHRKDASDFYKEQFIKNRKREMYLGATLVGPHREDLIFLIHQKEAKSFSSEGQKRCCVAALRLAEWQNLKQMVGSPPLMSIDDFGVHLDQNRQHLFQEEMKNLGQVFLTSPNLNEELAPLEKKQILLIEKGKILSS
jgi:DNA replication and repair protein RecF